MQNDTEKEQKVVLDAQDMDVIERFFTHFEIEIPDHLKTAVANFKQDQSIKNQDALKLALTKTVKEKQKDVLQIDEIFEPVIKACEEVAYNMQFDKDLEDVIGQEDSDNTTQNQTSQS